MNGMRREWMKQALFFLLQGIQEKNWRKKMKEKVGALIFPTIFFEKVLLGGKKKTKDIFVKVILSGKGHQNEK